MRGKRASERCPVACSGLIPACAGKTDDTESWPIIERAHPRVCGENARFARAVDIPPGSSPRVRGKPQPAVNQRWRGGLIPACAGKTMFSQNEFRLKRAHPRVCGENDLDAGKSHVSMGSSPRVRGKHGPLRSGDMVEGLIPACAGKTRRATILPAASRAHPRVCGENAFGRGLGLGNRGSSPRVRGKQLEWTGANFARGLIPACAGKTIHIPCP